MNEKGKAAEMIKRQTVAKASHMLGFGVCREAWTASCGVSPWSQKDPYWRMQQSRLQTLTGLQWRQGSPW